MTDPLNVDDLLDRFRRWLDAARAEIEVETETETEAPASSAPEGREVGLYRLVEEFTALRHELKLQTKSARGLQDQAEALLPALRQAIDQFRAVAPREAQAGWDAGKPLAEALADLDEALERGRVATEHALEQLAEGPALAFEAALDALAARQSWLARRLCRPFFAEARRLARDYEAEEHGALLDALREGYKLIQARLRRSLRAERIEAVSGVGEPVDLDRMIVVEVLGVRDLPPGVVVEEVRRGYTWQGRLLRPAEVRASRLATDDDDEDEDEVYEDAEENEDEPTDETEAPG